MLNYLHEHDIKLLVPRKWAARQDQKSAGNFSKDSKIEQKHLNRGHLALPKERFFSNWYAKTTDELIERTCLGLRSFIQNPDQVSSITSFPH